MTVALRGKLRETLKLILNGKPRVVKLFTNYYIFELVNFKTALCNVVVGLKLVIFSLILKIKFVLVL